MFFYFPPKAVQGFNQFQRQQVNFDDETFFDHTKASFNNEITRLSDGPAAFHLTLDSPVNLRHFVDWSLLTVCSLLRHPTWCKRIEM